MSDKPVDELTDSQKEELIVTYACLILQDSGEEITKEGLDKVIKASGASVGKHWTGLYAKMVAGQDVDGMLKLGGGGGGGGGGGAAAGGAAGGAAAGGGAAAAKEEVVEEEEEDMEFDLFD